MEHDDELEERERDFWDHEVAPLERCLEEFHEGPDRQTAAMIDALGDVRDRRILDFACGAGVTSAWLAQRGAKVTAIDLSPVTIARLQEVADALGLAAHIEPIAGEMTALGTRRFDGAVGRYALHHVDVEATGRSIAAVLEPGARASFLETFATNPVLTLARKTLIGRFGIPRYGTLDEHPLTRTDVAALRRIFGHVEVSAPELTFLRIFDRQVLHYNHPTASRVANAVDDTLGRSRHLSFLSYHQLVVCGPLPR